MASFCFTNSYFYIYNIFLLSTIIFLLGTAQISLCNYIISFTNTSFFYEYFIGIGTLLASVRAFLVFRSNNYSSKDLHGLQCHKQAMLYITGSVFLICVVLGAILVYFDTEYSYIDDISACASEVHGSSSNCKFGTYSFDCYGNQNYFTKAAQCEYTSKSTQCSCLVDGACYSFNGISGGCNVLTDQLKEAYYNAHTMSIVCVCALIAFSIVLFTFYFYISMYAKSLTSSILEESPPKALDDANEHFLFRKSKVMHFPPDSNTTSTDYKTTKINGRMSFQDAVAADANANRDSFTWKNQLGKITTESPMMYESIDKGYQPPQPRLYP